MNRTSVLVCDEHREKNPGCERIEDDGVSCLLEGGKSFIAKLITNEKLCFLVGVMIHEFFAKDVEVYDPLTALSFAFARFYLPFPSLPRKIR